MPSSIYDENKISLSYSLTKYTANHPNRLEFTCGGRVVEGGASFVEMFTNPEGELSDKRILYV